MSPGTAEETMTMTMNRPILYCLIPILCSGAALAAGVHTKELAVHPGERLVMRLETGGSIRIVGWDRDALAVEAEFDGEHADRVDFEVQRTADGVRISSDWTGSGRDRHAGGRVHVQLPRQFDLDLETGGGEIEIEGVEGRIRGETMGGELRLRELAGEIDLETMGGNIRLSDSDVDGSLETMGGNVVLRNVTGDVEAATMGGNVEYDNVRSAGRRCREVKISTMGGNIEAPDAGCGADLETMGGDITIARAAEYVNAETMGGNITVGEVDGWVRATTMGGNIEVRMVGDPGSGRRDVRLDSGGGDILLSLPDGLSMELDVALTYTKRSRQDYSIHSDFPLKISRSENWDYGQGTPFKVIYGKATVGSGEHKIKIETVNGNVRIERSR